VAEAQAKRIVSLPVYPELTGEQRQAVVTAIRDFYTP
jgi:dTDP-4-amino-4,6-dideoxygalactose transaminase